MNKKRILIFAVLHLIFTFGCVIFSIGAGMDRFDTLNEPTSIEKAIDYTTQVLMSPLYWLWTPWMSKNLHDSIEWLLFLLNSVLWGFLIEKIYIKIKLRKIST